MNDTGFPLAMEKLEKGKGGGVRVVFPVREKSGNFLISTSNDFRVKSGNFGSEKIR